MSKTVLANVDGFTPVIDVLVEEMGIMSAVVFGRVWRYCQMEDKVCKASLENISELIGVDRATVMRHVKQLCDAGYLKDLTPDLRNRPHIYVDTGKAGLEISISGVAQRNSQKTTVAQNNSGVAQSNTTVAQSKLNKVFKKDSKKEEEEGATQTQNIFSLYESEIGLLTPLIADALQDWEKVIPEKWMVDAITEAVKNNARNWAYVEAILKRWKAQGNQESAKKATRSNGKTKQTYEPVPETPEQFERRLKIAAELMGEK